MLNSTTWLYGAEVLPIALRSKVMGLAAASHFIVNVGSKFSQTRCRAAKYLICCQNQYWDTDPFTIFSVTEAGPSAFANIQENYYYVFVACSFFFLVVAYFYFP